MRGKLDALVHVDIGIFINNAGCIHPGPFLNVKPQDILTDIKVDLLASLVINSYLIGRLRAREHRSALIHMSSIGGVHLMPNLGVYCPIKRSLDIYPRILTQENSDKIDVLSVRPFGVSTQMAGFIKGVGAITPRQCVKGVLTDLLGRKRTTFGHYIHKASRVMLFGGNTEEQSLSLMAQLQIQKGLKK